MSKIIILLGSVRKGGNTDLLAQALPRAPAGRIQWKSYPLRIIRSIPALAAIPVLRGSRISVFSRTIWRGFMRS